MKRPRLLDLFCGAGGCAVGYHRAGFDVVGVDNRPQPRYPFDFFQGDALEEMEFLLQPGCGISVERKPSLRLKNDIYLDDIAAIHASPPCQAFTAMRRLGKGAGRKAVDLVEPIRELLVRSGRPYVIENVPGCPLKFPAMLCGSLFGLGVRRHRIFESNVLILSQSCCHGPDSPLAVYGDHPQQPGNRPQRVNRARTLAEGQRAMGIDWMEWRELTQAIPPAYTEFIGRQLIRILNNGDEP